MNSLVLHHVLLVAHPLSERAVARAMQDCEAADAAHYAAAPVRQRDARTRPALTDDVLHKLRGAVQTAGEAVVLTMLLELGLRVGAIANARLSDVWDASAGRVIERARLVEKNCVRRDVWFGPELVQQLQRYVTEERRGEGPLLFPNPSRRSPDLPSEGALVSVIRRLCRRAHVPRINCHLFRHYVINRLVEKGNSLEAVSKWIGHRNVEVTYRSYYRPVLHPGMDVCVCESETGSASASASAGDGETAEKAQRFDALVAQLRRTLPAEEVRRLLHEAGCVDDPDDGDGRDDYEEDDDVDDDDGRPSTVDPLYA